MYRCISARNICTGPPEIEPSSMHNLSLVPGQQVSQQQIQPLVSTKTAGRSAADTASP